MKTAIVAAILWLALIIAVAAGYIINLVELIGANSFGVLEAARMIGLIVAPLGVLLGYLA